MCPIAARRLRLGRALVVVLATVCAGLAGARPDYDWIPDLIQTVTTDPSYKVRVSSAS